LPDTSRRASTIAAFTILAALAAATCATGSASNPKYPRRPPRCPIRIIHTSTPDVPTWDDIGMAEVGCYIDDGPGTCLQRLREEGCRMGGDMIYDVPKRPSRPNERALVFRGHVAHTRAADKRDGGAEEPAEAASGPVVPLGRVPEPPAPVDAGTASDGGASDQIGPAPGATNLTP
jgi:hypothetical protein